MNKGNRRSERTAGQKKKTGGTVGGCCVDLWH